MYARRFLGAALLALALSTPARADMALDVVRGIASFYDCKKPGECSPHKITASGQRFNAAARTCAHKKHRFGTLLRVTNLRNGLSTVCRVNDRGPFVVGRVVDLTPAGARALRFSGIAPVKLERIN